MKRSKTGIIIFALLLIIPFLLSFMFTLVSQDNISKLRNFSKYKFDEAVIFDDAHNLHDSFGVSQSFYKLTSNKSVEYAYIRPYFSERLPVFSTQEESSTFIRLDLPTPD